MLLELELQADRWEREQDFRASLANDVDYQNFVNRLHQAAVLQQEHPDADVLPTKEDDLTWDWPC